MIYNHRFVVQGEDYQKLLYQRMKKNNNLIRMKPLRKVAKMNYQQRNLKIQLIKMINQKKNPKIKIKKRFQKKWNPKI
jgi:hypothetical protein